jgi:hypothetical protein
LPGWYDFHRSWDDKTCSFLNGAESILVEQRYSEIPDFLKKEEPLFSHAFPFVMFPVNEWLSSQVFREIKFDLESEYYTKSPTPIKEAPLLSGIWAAMFPYFLSNLWPFFLAFGLALRITRVTADVTEWPKP